MKREMVDQNGLSLIYCELDLLALGQLRKRLPEQDLLSAWEAGRKVDISQTIPFTLEK